MPGLLANLILCAANATTSAEPPTDISVVSAPRLKAALADIEKYLTDNFDTPTAGGAAYLPNNVLLLGGVTLTNDVKWLAAEMRQFTDFLMQLCPKHRIQNLASAFDNTESNDPHIVKVNGLPLALQEHAVTCIRLY